MAGDGEGVVGHDRLVGSGELLRQVVRALRGQKRSAIKRPRHLVSHVHRSEEAQGE